MRDVVRYSGAFKLRVVEDVAKGKLKTKAIYSTISLWF
jgi:transposase-like protein